MPSFPKRESLPILFSSFHSKVLTNATQVSMLCHVFDAPGNICMVCIEVMFSSLDQTKKERLVCEEFLSLDEITED